MDITEQIELQLDYNAPEPRHCQYGDHGYDPYDRYCFFCGYDRGPKKWRKLIAELEYHGTPGCRDLAAALRKKGD